MKVEPFLSLAFFRFSATKRYMFFKASRDKIVSSVPRYLILGLKVLVNGSLGSLPNIRKKGLSLECSLGRKL